MLKEEYGDGAYFVWTKRGRWPHYRHDTYQQAEAEAMRLALANPGRKFIVVQFHAKLSEPATLEEFRAINGFDQNPAEHNVDLEAYGVAKESA